MPLIVDLQSRRRQPELMDDPGLERQRHVEALDALARVNRLSFSARRVWSAIRHQLGDLPGAGAPPLRILDVACGGGDVAVDLGRLAARDRACVEIAGCDASPVAVERAARRASETDSDARFFELDVIADTLPRGYDVICSSLFLHHLEEREAVDFLAGMAAAARRLLVVQDLARSHLGYVLAWAGTRLLSGSDVASVDGPRSVRTAFTLAEARRLVGRAGLEGARLRRCWPQRFSIVWRTT